MFLIPSCSLWDPADSISPYRLSSSALFGHFPFFSHPLITKPHYTHYQPFSIFLVFPNLQPSVLSKANQRLRLWVRRNSFFSPALPGFTTGPLGRACRLPGHVSGGPGCPPRESSFLAPRPSLSPRSDATRRASAPARCSGSFSPRPPPSGSVDLSPRHISSHGDCCLSPASPRLLLALTLLQQLPN